MYLYKFGYHSYEDSGRIVLSSETQYSDQEFKQMIFDATNNVLKNIIINNSNHVYLSEDGVSFSEIWELVASELEAKGFSPVKYQTEWSCFGWPSITNGTDWNDQRGLELTELTNNIPIELKNTINKLGEEREEMNKKELHEWWESHKKELSQNKSDVSSN